MNTLKLFAVLTVAVGSVALVLSTGAFSAVNADRQASVGVTNDESALLGITAGGGTINPGDRVTLFTVENQFGEDLSSIDVTVLDSGPFNNVVVQSAPDTLDTGAAGDITATVAGAPGTAGTIDVEIVAAGESGSVELTREVFVEIERAGPALCTIESDDRIGERSFFAEDAFFDCTIRIDADNQYEVGGENVTATGGFELSARLLKAFEFEGGDVGGATDIAIGQNANGDVSFETTTFGDDVSIGVEGVAKGISFEGTAIGGAFDLSTGNQNGDVSIENADIDGGVDMTFDGPVSGDVSTEGSRIGGDYEIDVRNNLNSGISLEGTTVGGDLIITVGKNANGDISIEGATVGGDLTVVVDGRLNGDISIEGATVGGDLTVDADTERGGGEVELEDNTVGGTVTRP
jgi:hypothetical protein